MIIHSPTHTYGHLCGVWKRVIGTDVNPARRRLVTTEVRAHRFINQFAHRSSLSLAKILKEKAPPKKSRNESYDGGPPPILVRNGVFEKKSVVVLDYTSKRFSAGPEDK